MKERECVSVWGKGEVGKLRDRTNEWDEMLLELMPTVFSNLICLYSLRLICRNEGFIYNFKLIYGQSGSGMNFPANQEWGRGYFPEREIGYWDGKSFCPTPTRRFIFVLIPVPSQLGRKIFPQCRKEPNKNRNFPPHYQTK